MSMWGLSAWVMTVIMMHCADARALANQHNYLIMLSTTVSNNMSTAQHHQAAIALGKSGAATVTTDESYVSRKSVSRI